MNRGIYILVERKFSGIRTGLKTEHVEKHGFGNLLCIEYDIFDVIGNRESMHDTTRNRKVCLWKSFLD